MSIGWYNLYYGRNEDGIKSALTLDDYINVWLCNEAIDDVERLAGERNVSRSRIVREAVNSLIFSKKHDPSSDELGNYHACKTDRNVFVRVNHVHADELRKFAESHDATVSATVRYAINLYLNGGNE